MSSRNHKPQAVHSRGKSGGNTLLGVFIGLVVGVVIAFGLVWYLNKSPMPFQDKTSRNNNGDAPLPAQAPTAKPAVPGTPEPLPGKPGDKPVEKPRFEFYNILPGKQDAAPAPAAAAEKPAAPAEAIFLQVGAFQKPADADNLKAKLALMGVEASVQDVTVPDKGVMHRVRVGPFASPEDMNRVRNQLAQGGVQATLVKVKDAN
jgi:cell division protein FtsN